MVASKKKKLEDPYEALQRLMDDPGSNVEVWDDLFSATTDDPLGKIKNAMLGLPKYDDRVAAIVYGASLERSLEGALLSHFVSDPNTSQRIFTYHDNGPLATFHSKILLGHALGIYERKMYEDLRMLKQIRNAFAHARLHVDFNTPAVIAGCKSLHCKLTGREHSPLAPARERFTFIVAFLSTYLGGQIKGHTKPLKFKDSRLYASLYGLPEPSPEKPVSA